MGNPAAVRAPRALQAGLRAIRSFQLADGSFTSSSSPSRRPFSATASYASPFATSLILSCLREAGDPSLLEAGALFLAGQRSAEWTFNYWSRDSAEMADKPYPDDLDDTFCALAALQLVAPGLVTGETLARATKVLTYLEEQPGGPYRTWLIVPDASPLWKDVDLAVNANVAYFLSLHEISLPGLTALAEQAIRSGRYASPYYPGPYPLMYFLARWYRGRLAGKLRRDILAGQAKDGSWEGSPLLTALAVSSLLRLGASRQSLNSALSYLVESQSEDGSWPAEGFCFDPAKGGVPYHAGSRALTTAFCLEALVTAQPTKAVRPEAKSSLPSLVQDRLQVFSSLNIAELLGERSLQEVLSLPAATAAALTERPQPDKDMLDKIASGTLFGWIAYTIYDKFLDEGGDAKLLPVANLAQREMNRLFLTLLPNTNFPMLVGGVLDRVDLANAWEAQHCRCAPDAVLSEIDLPDYGDLMTLADRSLGHGLATLATLVSAGYSCECPQVPHIREFFEHYLIARQLNDDAHDWREDLAHGQINAVAAQLLAVARPKLDPSLPLNHPTVTEALNKLFWKSHIIKVAKRVLAEAGQARESLSHVTILKAEAFEPLLLPVEAAARQALEEHGRTSDFLKAYASRH